MEYTKTIETPIGKHKVVLKTLVTGAEREQIDGAEFEFLRVDVDDKGEKKITIVDNAKMMLAVKHKFLQTCVICIDEDTTTPFERLQKMYERDYNFVYESLIAEQKKMNSST